MYTSVDFSTTPCPLSNPFWTYLHWDLDEWEQHHLSVKPLTPASPSFLPPSLFSLFTSYCLKLWIWNSFKVLVFLPKFEKFYKDSSPNTAALSHKFWRFSFWIFLHAVFQSQSSVRKVFVFDTPSIKFTHMLLMRASAFPVCSCVSDRDPRSGGEQGLNILSK